MKTFSLAHVDTCLSCYVQDHCNGDNETLIGVTLTNEDTYKDVLDEVLRELHSFDPYPAEWSDADWAAAEACIRAEFSNAMPSDIFDDSLEDCYEYDMGEPCYAWFRLDWEDEDETEV